MAQRGRFAFSLDFELFWGIRDQATKEATRARIMGTRDAVPRLLDLFVKRGVRATWATVGFLMCSGRDELVHLLQRHLPQLLDPSHPARLNPAEFGRNQVEDPHHFAPDLVEQVRLTDGQEIGTHTLSHFYCLESGQGIDDFRDDVRTAMALAQEKNVGRPVSLVFPRNQVNVAYLEALGPLGIECYRGNPDHWLYDARHRKGEMLARRAARLLDAYVSISGPNTATPSRLPSGVVNVPASRLFRSWTPKLRFVESQRLQRILRDMEYAARTGQTYHLWSHPYNFGENTSQNLKMLDVVLERFTQLRDEHGMLSLTMAETARQINRPSSGAPQRVAGSTPPA